MAYIGINKNEGIEDIVNPITKQVFHCDINGCEIAKDFKRDSNKRFEPKKEPKDDFERDFGIDLETFSKALKQEYVYTKYSPEPHHFMVENRFGKYLIYDKEWLIQLKDYGKTWALTKEELEKE